MRALAADAGLLHAAERRRRVGHDAAVEADHPGLECLTDPQPAAQVALVWFAKSDAWVLIGLAAAVGASALVLYPLSSAHTQDLGGRENAVEVSSGLLLAYTIGAVVGPTTAAWLMGWIGPQALFIHRRSWP